MCQNNDNNLRLGLFDIPREKKEATTKPIFIPSQIDHIKYYHLWNSNLFFQYANYHVYYEINHYTLTQDVTIIVLEFLLGDNEFWCKNYIPRLRCLREMNQQYQKLVYIRNNFYDPDTDSWNPRWVRHFRRNYFISYLKNFPHKIQYEDESLLVIDYVNDE